MFLACIWICFPYWDNLCEPHTIRNRSSFPEAGLLVKSLKRNETGDWRSPQTLVCQNSICKNQIFYNSESSLYLGLPSPTNSDPSRQSMGLHHLWPQHSVWLGGKVRGAACHLHDLFRNTVSPSLRELWWVVALDISVCLGFFALGLSCMIANIL